MRSEYSLLISRRAAIGVAKNLGELKVIVVSLSRCIVKHGPSRKRKRSVIDGGSVSVETHDFHMLNRREYSLGVRMLLNDEHFLDGVPEKLLGGSHNRLSSLVEQLLADSIQPAFQKALQSGR